MAAVVAKVRASRAKNGQKIVMCSDYLFDNGCNLEYCHIMAYRGGGSVGPPTRLLHSISGRYLSIFIAYNCSSRCFYECHHDTTNSIADTFQIPPPGTGSVSASGGLPASESVFSMERLELDMVKGVSIQCLTQFFELIQSV